MWTNLSRYRYTWLLVALVGMLAAEPLLAHETVHSKIASSSVLIALALTASLVALSRGRDRWIAVTLALPAVTAELAHYAVAGRTQSELAMVFHISMALFLTLMVLAVLRHIFRERDLTIDDIVGAFCGYLMIAVLWANLYGLVALLVPDAFTIAPQIAWQLQEWHARRALFDYFSFAVQASIGYADITTTSPTSNTLAWMQVMSGQFYLAVVVASVVGMKLASAGRAGGSDRT